MHNSYEDITEINEKIAEQRLLEEEEEFFKLF